MTDSTRQTPGDAGPGIPLAAWRHHTNMTQNRLCQASGVSVRTIKRVESGTPPSMETAAALCAVFGCGADALRAGPPPATPTGSDATAHALALGWVSALLGGVLSFELFQWHAAGVNRYASDWDLDALCVAALLCVLVAFTGHRVPWPALRPGPRVLAVATGFGTAALTCGVAGMQIASKGQLAASGQVMIAVTMSAVAVPAYLAMTFGRPRDVLATMAVAAPYLLAVVITSQVAATAFGAMDDSWQMIVLAICVPCLRRDANPVLAIGGLAAVILPGIVVCWLPTGPTGAPTLAASVASVLPGDVVAFLAILSRGVGRHASSAV